MDISQLVRRIVSLLALGRTLDASYLTVKAQMLDVAIGQGVHVGYGN